ncbi:hypothetical protein Scep_003317 [Stephania cephalantha]|uniref:Uncharacterized protein n=1 Tax=Stephania cephalantha TaxID=152367 RepID=A0AAP0PUB3_9MAGN
MVARAMDGDRELKRVMHPKLGSDPRPRSSEAQGFGLGHFKWSLWNQQGRWCFSVVSLQMPVQHRGMSRMFVKTVKRGSLIQLQKGRPLGRREQFKCAKFISSFFTDIGTLDGWEQSSSCKQSSIYGRSKQSKAAVPTGSSSPPVARWVGQRPQKISRTRRANLVSHMSNHDDSHMSSEGFPAPDVGARISSSETSGPLMLRGASSNTQQFKMKLEHVPSPVGLSRRK